MTLRLTDASAEGVRCPRHSDTATGVLATCSTHTAARSTAMAPAVRDAPGAAAAALLADANDEVDPLMYAARTQDHCGDTKTALERVAVVHNRDKGSSFSKAKEPSSLYADSRANSSVTCVSNSSRDSLVELNDANGVLLHSTAEYAANQQQNEVQEDHVDNDCDDKYIPTRTDGDTTNTANTSDDSSDNDNDTINGASVKDSSTDRASDGACGGDSDGDCDGYVMQVPDAAENDQTALASGVSLRDGLSIAAAYEAGAEILKRVMVYELDSEGAWLSKGTGRLATLFLESRNNTCMVVRSDQDDTSILLVSPILSDRVYSRQQNTLILWTEDNGQELALSFVDVNDCNDVLAMLITFKSDLDPSSMDVLHCGHDINSITARELALLVVPKPSADTALAIEGLFIKANGSLIHKDRLLKILDADSFLKHVLEVFSSLEETNSIDLIFSLSHTVRLLIAMLDTARLPLLTRDCIFVPLLGVLEYDRYQTAPKENYRECYKARSKLRDSISYLPQHVEDMFVHVYRLQYLKDVVLAKNMDDSMGASFSASILSTLSDAIREIYQNAALLSHLFTVILNKNTSPADRRYSVMFLKDLCSIKQTVIKLRRHFPANFNSNFLFSLNFANGLYDALLLSFVSRDVEIRKSMTSILMVIIEQDAELLRTICESLEVVHRSKVPDKNTRINDILQSIYTSRWSDVKMNFPQVDSIVAEDKASSFLELLIYAFVNDKEPSLRAQYGSIIRTLLSFTIATDHSEFSLSQAQDGLILRSMLSETLMNSFMDMVYGRYTAMLFSPMIRSADFRRCKSRDKRYFSEVYIDLCNMLCFLLKNHSNRSKILLLRYPDIMTSVSDALSETNQSLVLNAIKVLDICIRSKDASYHRMLISTGAISKLVKLLETTTKKRNMVNSACISMFELLVQENVAVLIRYVVDNYRETLSTVLHSDVFRALCIRFEVLEDSKNVDVEVPSMARARSASMSLLSRPHDSVVSQSSDSQTLTGSTRATHDSSVLVGKELVSITPLSDTSDVANRFTLDKLGLENLDGPEYSLQHLLQSAVGKGDEMDQEHTSEDFIVQDAMHDLLRVRKERFGDEDEGVPSKVRVAREV